MSVTKLHWLFKERFNKLDSSHYRDLTPIQIDTYLNDALTLFGESLSDDEDTFQKIDLISELVVTYPEQPALIPDSVNDDVYEFKLSNLEYPYWRIKRVHTSTSCGLVDIDVTGTGRLNVVLNDEFSRPSKKWRRLVCTIEKSSTEDGKSLYVHSIPEFTVESVKLDYIRRPKDIFFGGYNTIEYTDCLRNNGLNCGGRFYSNSSDPQDLEIQDKTVRMLIVDLAVKEAARTLGDVAKVQLNADKIQGVIQ